MLQHIGISPFIGHYSVFSLFYQRIQVHQTAPRTF